MNVTDLSALEAAISDIPEGEPEIGSTVSVLTPGGGYQVGLFLGQQNGEAMLVDLHSGAISTPAVERIDRQALADPAVTALARTLSREVWSAKANQRSWDAWKESLIETAHDEGDRRGWCSDFDDLLEELGLPRRQREYQVSVTVSCAISVEVTAGSEDEACEMVTLTHVREVLGNEFDWDIESTEVD